MAPRYFVEELPSGRRQFVLKRSRSHHHHKHHHHDHTRTHEHHDYYTIHRSEWNALVERERHLSESNIALVADNSSLKTALSNSEAEVSRLGGIVSQQRRQIDVLCSENDSLQRSIDNVGQHSSHHHRELDKLQGRLDKVERERRELRDTVSDLRHRNKCLSEQLDEAREQRGSSRGVDYWRDLYYDWRHRADRLSEKVAAYEDILVRNRYI